MLVEKNVVSSISFEAGLGRKRVQLVFKFFIFMIAELSNNSFQLC